MGLLKDFFVRNQGKASLPAADTETKVVSFLDKKNQRIERQLADCMKEIQRNMAQNRSQKSPQSRVKITSLVKHPEPTPA